LGEKRGLRLDNCVEMHNCVETHNCASLLSKKETAPHLSLTGRFGFYGYLFFLMQILGLATLKSQALLFEFLEVPIRLDIIFSMRIVG
jgi:hypothetical protein